MPIYPTVEEALTLGGSKLAVDGVVIIGEHGEYPSNDQGQTLYPRYKFFKQVVKVFEVERPQRARVQRQASLDRMVAVRGDGERLEAAEISVHGRLVAPRHAAACRPSTCRYGTPLSESVCVGYGRPDSYDFHGLETAQCMSERRKGGEMGIKSVQALRGEKLWDYVATRDATQRLLVAALDRSHNLPEENGYPTEPVSFDWARKVFPEGYGYFIEHRDGLRTSLFMLPIRDFNYAGLNSETGEIISCQMYLPMPDHGSTTADFFNPLVHYIEQMIVSNAPPYPIERTLLTSGMTLAGVDSLHRGGEIVQTPEMEVRYQPPKESQYWMV